MASMARSPWEDDNLQPMNDEELGEFIERWLRELPERRRRTREAIENLGYLAEGRLPPRRRLSPRR